MNSVEFDVLNFQTTLLYKENKLGNKEFRQIDLRVSGMSDLHKWFDGSLVKIYWKNDEGMYQMNGKEPDIIIQKKAGVSIPEMFVVFL